MKYENILKIENEVRVEDERLPRDKYKNMEFFKENTNELGYANYLFLGLMSGLVVLVTFILFVIK